MKFTLILYLEHNILSVEYRKAVISYIKNALSNVRDGKYYELFFKDTNQKPYSFSVILPKSKFHKDKIEIEGNEIKIEISSSDKDSRSLILFNAILAQKNKEFPLKDGNKMTLKTIINKKIEKIESERAIFKTTLGGGLCVRDHNRESNKDTYYIFSDKDFREKLKVVTNNQLYKAGFTESEIAEVKINVIQGKKAVVKHYSRYIDLTTNALIEIQGKKEILKYFYEVGIGSRRSEGFGMLDLVTQDLI